MYSAETAYLIEYKKIEESVVGHLDVHGVRHLTLIYPVLSGVHALNRNN